MTHDRRAILKALTVTATALTAGTIAVPAQRAAASTATDSWTAQTLLAFADTLIPGGQRFPGDVVVAGVVSGPGAADAGVIDLLTSPQLPLAPLLPSIAGLLDTRAIVYATARLIWLPPLRPPFVGLPFTHRTTVVGSLFGPDDADRPIWQVLSMLVGLAFDTAGQYDTSQALAQEHPGLKWLNFPPPDADGLWRFPHFSYGRPLASKHPDTTPSGSPA